LVGDNTAYAARVTRLEGDLTRERAISARLATLEGPGHAPEPKPEDIPDPDDFDGTRANLRPFLMKLRLKIAGNATRFPNVQHQLRYAFGFLKGDAYATIEPHLVNDRLNFATLEEFTQVLKMAFGDPDETRTAALELLLGFLCWDLRRVREAGRARTRLGFGFRSGDWESTGAHGIRD